MARFKGGVVKASAFVFASLHILASLAAPTAQVHDPWVIDTFGVLNTNDIGAWHGGDEGMFTEYGPGYVRLMPEHVDMGYHTQVSADCVDLTPYEDMYIHVFFAGTDKFTISLSENNEACTRNRSPSPATWDSVEASRYVYAGGQHIYIPVSHFNINLTRASAIDFHGFYTTEELQLFKVEITSSVPAGFVYRMPKKLPSGTVVLSCKRPNSFAFGIDDGNPQYTQQVMDLLEEEGILVTFFTVGNALVDPDANFTGMYKEMLNRGHQVALHTYSHPRVEGLQTIEEIDFQFTENIKVMKEQLGIESRYFRPPYGLVGARTRQRLASMIRDPYIINWSVDVQDWLWADSDTPERQLNAFRRDLKDGGDLAVMHFTHNTTVSYFKEFFDMVRETGKQIMRVDQCLEDPEAPPLV